MKILPLNIPEIKYGDGKYYIYNGLKVGDLQNSSPFGTLLMHYFYDFNGLQTEFKATKNVNVTKDEFEERKKRDDSVRANDFEGYDWDFDNNPLYYHIMDTPERYGDDKHATVPYIWSDGEFGAGGTIYKDISIFYFDSTYGEKEEIYKTSEVIEFLTKLIEILKEVEELNKKLD